ncbi:MAG: AAA family ATPase, partial [Byssovorax sp.]
MIKTFRARNYGCLMNVTAPLTPLHAFIGPNDSGKSTLLHGMRTVVQLASGEFSHEGEWRPFNPFLPIRFPFTGGEPKIHDTALGCSVNGGWYTYEVDQGPQERVSMEGAGDVIGSGPCQLSQRFVIEPSGLDYHA